MELNPGKKIYFFSDVHLGTPDKETSRKREKLLVQWLDEIKPDAQEIYIVGDLFDFWYEYKYVVPKGYVRILGKLAELSDSGIKIHFFTGNHDMWMFSYLEEEMNIKTYRSHIRVEMNGKKFLIGHGDGLGPGDLKYKFLKKIFANKLCQWLFRQIHPDLGMRIANFWSRRSRYANGTLEQEEFQGESREWLVAYARKVLKDEHIDYFVFGHRHIAIDYGLREDSRYINLGDWLGFYTYAVFDGKDMELKYYNRP